MALSCADGGLKTPPLFMGRTSCQEFPLDVQLTFTSVIALDIAIVTIHNTA